MKILALRGDGIGPEIVDSTIKVLKIISQKFNFNLDLIYSDIGFSSIESTFSVCSGLTVIALS